MNFWGTKIEKKDFDVSFDDEGKALTFKFRYRTENYRLVINAEGRDTLFSGFSKYQSDFSGKKLDRALKDKASFYKTAKGTIFWSSSNGELNGTADVDLILGYEFVEKNAYFSINIPACKNSLYDSDKSKLENSPALTLYFLPSQISNITEALYDKK